MHPKRRRTFPLPALAALAGAVTLAGLAAAQGPPGSEGRAMEAGWEASAEPVGDATCAGCHDDVLEAMQGRIHARIERFEVQGRAVGCEGCHGPGSEHAESMDTALIRGFGPDAPAAQTCLSCHRGKGQTEWPASAHAIEGFDCTACHTIHTASRPEQSCRTCHGDVEARFQLPSHHPVREGKMTCASCHDVHGASEAALRGPFGRPLIRKDQLCYECHQAVEGPFVFEHEPVEEDCSICHTPHGSVANNLLSVSQPALCLQCHELHFHAGYDASESGEVDVGGIERENPWGPEGFRIAFTTNCTQCHTKIHGSDLPSQSVPGRGEALLQ
ncbi:MAG: GSU2203 family decaheme c-type cytochrome [Acidobacteriota bacterium]|jgi:DmsE family decaheme c-type cytochrome